MVGLRRGLLRVVTASFVAGVVYRREEAGRWVPDRAAPILGWVMAHETSANMKRYLDGPAKRAGWEYQWMPINETERQRKDEA